MELSGHPTEDLVEELVERGAVLFEGDHGPGEIDPPEPALGPGRWLWLPETAFEAGLDEPFPEP